jgi:hypothetical protein
VALAVYASASGCQTMGIAMKLIISALLSALLSKLLLSTSAWAAVGEDDTSGSNEPPARKKVVADQD